MPSPATIYDNSESMKEARARYYQTVGFSDYGDVSDIWVRYKFGRWILIAFPNFDHRRYGILRHDLHHIINDLDTSILGEGLLAGWEIGSGFGHCWLARCVEPQALWWGLWHDAKKTYEYFLAGRQSKNLYLAKSLDEYLELSVGEARAALRNKHAHSKISDILLFAFYALFGGLMFAIFLPIYLFFIFWGFAFGLNKRLPN